MTRQEWDSYRRARPINHAPGSYRPPSNIDIDAAIREGRRQVRRWHTSRLGLTVAAALAMVAATAWVVNRSSVTLPGAETRNIAAAAPISDPTVTVQSIIDDMTAPGLPAHGTPDWPASKSGGLDFPNVPAGWNAATGWAVVSRECLDVTRCHTNVNGYDSQDVNTRVAVRGLNVYMFDTNHVWTRVQPYQFTGAHFTENFSANPGPRTLPANLRTEPDGSVSDKLVHNRVFHFYPNSRFQFDPSKMVGLYITMQTRLIVDDPVRPDDRASARYIMNVGADWWRSMTAQLCGYNCNAMQVMHSRYVQIANDWRSVSATSINLASLKAFPPPGVGNAPAAPTVSLQAARTSLQPGETTTLTWKVSNATACSANSPDAAWRGTRPTAGGSVTIKPTTTTTYAMTCTGPGGRRSASTVVTVGSPPPPPPTSVTVEADTASVRRGTAVLRSAQTGASGNAYVGHVYDGDHLGFTGLNLTGMTSVVMRVATPFDGSTIEVRAGSATGPLLGKVSVPNTHGWVPSWQTVTTPLVNTTGVRTVYLVFHNPKPWGVVDLDWMQFAKAAVQPPQPRRVEAESTSSRNGGEVFTNTTAGASGNAYLGRIFPGHWIGIAGIDLTNVRTIQVRVATPRDGATIEVRTASVTGPLVGTIVLPNTHNWAGSWQTATATLKPSTGRQNLILVFRLPGSAGVTDIDWISLS